MITKKLLVVAIAMLSSLSWAAGPKPTVPKTPPQASLTLKDTNLNLCQASSYSWGVLKSGSLSNQSVTWNVSSVKGSQSQNNVKALGYVQIQNTSEGLAPIGNIVVNLQRKVGKNWITVSSDVADATLGDSSTSAKICSTASSENLSTFAENSASGSLEFTDALTNTAFSLVPQAVLGANQSYNLLFTASFNNSILNIPTGESVRFEIIVSFSNSGGRGDSGASCSNVDVSGNGLVDASEQYVRSIPSRVTMKIPAPVAVNNSVLLSDLESQLATTGTVAYAGYQTDIGAGSGTQQISSSQNNYVSVLVSGGTQGGTITNCATQTSPDYTVLVNGPLDPLTGLPIYSYNFICEQGISNQACNTVSVPSDNGNPPPPPTGSFTSYTQGGWGATPNGNNPAMLLQNNFNAVFTSGYVLVGKSSGNYMKFTSASSVGAYLPAGGPASALTSNLVNPTSSSAGVFGGQVLALQLNVSFSNANVTQSSLAALKLKDTGTPLDGKTVQQILDIANELLGGGTVLGVTISMLNPIVTSLNESYDNGNQTSWAVLHLY